MNLLSYETQLWNNGIDLIAGIDEVGRGPIAGPLVTAAVILRKEDLHNNDVISTKTYELYSEIKDSKKLSAKKRERLSVFIKEVAIEYSIQTIEPAKVDEWGISKATQIAFFSSIKKLKVRPHHILTDTFELKGTPLSKQTNIIQGDNKSITIAAASIIAKVFRDDLMAKHHETYSEYGFAQHKGYGTKAHIEALFTYGPCALHRKSFEPVKSWYRSRI